MSHRHPSVIANEILRYLTNRQESREEQFGQLLSGIVCETAERGDSEVEEVIALHEQHEALKELHAALLNLSRGLELNENQQSVMPRAQELLGLIVDYIEADAAQFNKNVTNIQVAIQRLHGGSEIAEAMRKTMKVEIDNYNDTAHTASVLRIQIGPLLAELQAAVDSKHRRGRER